MSTDRRPTHPILAAIGNTPLVELQRIVPPDSARIVLKLESANPTGGMKDRVARAMVEAAIARGSLAPGGTVVEYTGGTTGASLALVCAALGYRAHFVSSDAFSADKLRAMRALGAELTVIPSGDGRITRALIEAMIAEAHALAQRPGHWFCDQLHNRDGEAGYHALGDELWAQAGGRVDAFVQAVGSVEGLRGTAQALRRHHAGVRIVAAEPAETPVLAGGAPGAHRIEGIGIGFVPPLWDAGEVDEIDCASSEEAYAMARRLAREEGLLVGISSGAAAAVAVRLAKLPEFAGKTIVTVLPDAAERYLSTTLFEDLG